MKVSSAILLNFFFIPLLALNCQSNRRISFNKLKTFDLKTINHLSIVKLSDLNFNDIEYIPLETTEESVLQYNEVISLNWGNYRTIVSGNYFLLKLWNKIYKFGMDGKFMGEIGIEGRGPNEYLLAHDIDVKKESHNIYLVSAWQKKINVYSENGEFIRTFQIQLNAPINFRFTEGKILCYCNNLQGNVENSYVLMDTNGLVIKNYANKYPFTKHKDGYFFQYENLFYQFNNELYIKEVYSDTVYKYENMAFKPHLIIQLGKRTVTPKARSELDGIQIGGNYIKPLNLFEFGNFVFFSFIYSIVPSEGAKLYGFIGSKEGNFRAIFDLKQGLINDLDGGPNILPFTIKDDNTVIAIIGALELKNHISSDTFKNSTPRYPEKKKKLEKLANTLKETDNPVLILIKLK